MSEIEPLYIWSEREGKELTELLFWYELYQLKLLLVVLANEPYSGLPMVLLLPENGDVFQSVVMPRTMTAELAQDSEVSDELKERVKFIRENFKA